MTKILMIIVMMFMWATSAMADHMRYVVPDGIDDSNTCTDIDNPCASIKHAITQADKGDLIEIAGGVYTEAGIVVEKEIAIEGDGSEKTIIQAAERLQDALDRVFLITEGVKVSISDITIRHGKSPLVRRVFGTGRNPIFNFSPGGGAILNLGELIINRSDLTDNSTGNVRRGDVSISAHGGALANYGKLTINNSFITHNETGLWLGSDEFVSANGGGIYNVGALTLNYCTVSNNATRDVGTFNQLSGHGGGIYNSGILTINHSTIEDNITGDGMASGHGGGIANQNSININNCSILRNRTGNSHGDPHYFSRSGLGGGIYNISGTLINNSTVSGNQTGKVLVDIVDGDKSAYKNGGGIFNDGELTIKNSTITDNATGDGDGGGLWNSSGKVNIGNTILSGNSVIGGMGSDCFGDISSEGYNLIGDTVGCTINGDQTGNITRLDPKIGTLQNNGGMTMTHALLKGSPAIDTGDPQCSDLDGEILLTDQRGLLRPVDGDIDDNPVCDIGAVEFFPNVNKFVAQNKAPDTTFDSNPVPGGPLGTFTIATTFINISSISIKSPFFVVSELTGGNLLLNADGAGTTLTPDVVDEVLLPGESMTVGFVIGLQGLEKFTFIVDLLGAPES